MGRKKPVLIQRVMGIDQAATGNCGFALVECLEGAEIVLLDWKTECYVGLSRDRRGRLQRYIEVFRELYQAWAPDIIVIEQVRAHNGFGVSVSTIAALSNIIALTVVHSNCPVYSVNTTHWKHVVVKGQKKTDAIDFIADVQKKFFVEHEALTEHSSEAGCIAMYPFIKMGELEWRKEH